MGDVNSDNYIDIVDAFLVAQYYVGLDPITLTNLEAADVDCVNGIDIVDALLIAQYYVGIITEFPCTLTPAPTPSLGQGVMTGELKMWHKVTVTWDGPDTSETADPNPFTDYRLSVTFTGPNGQVYLVPGYYAADGDAAHTSASRGNKWRCHISPDEQGVWSYSVSFRSGTNIAQDDNPSAGSPAGFMDGDSGSFSVGPTDKTGRDMRSKGHLKYVDGHYLQFAGNNEYFLKQGPDAQERWTKRRKHQDILSSRG